MTYLKAECKYAARGTLLELLDIEGTWHYVSTTFRNG